MARGLLFARIAEGAVLGPLPQKLVHFVAFGSETILLQNARPIELP